MAEHQPGSGPRPTTRSMGGPTGGTFLRRVHDHAPNSTQVIGFLTLIISGGILLLLAGLTLTVTVLGLIILTPLILLSSPIWVPAGTILVMALAGFLTMCVIGLAGMAGVSWMYKYVKGRHPPGSNRVDYARTQIANTATHMKDYAREYGGYLQSKVKDVAPGA
ncbi:oleosin G-like [Tasmannia lanceolata]|uniref:oleosin G-like n=1 Tax=Tasmannia lanceolata TaxID=3420 RepID=UPI004062E491